MRSAAAQNWTDVLLNSGYSVADIAAGGEARPRAGSTPPCSLPTPPYRAPSRSLPYRRVSAARRRARARRATPGATTGPAARSSPWADPASYMLAPGGDFENNSSHWTLVAASRDTTTTRPFHVTGRRTLVAEHRKRRRRAEPRDVRRARVSRPRGCSSSRPAGCRARAAGRTSCSTTQRDHPGRCRSGCSASRGSGGCRRELLALGEPGCRRSAPARTAVAFRFTAIGGSFRSTTSTSIRGTSPDRPLWDGDQTGGLRAARPG